MANLYINTFRGQASREQKLLKANTFAECAVNAQLSDGALSPMPCPEEVCTQPNIVKEIYTSRECDCRSFDRPSYVERYGGSVYLVNSRFAVRYLSYDLCNDNSAVGMGIPCPTNRPVVASSSVTEGCGFAPRQYMYTFVAKHSDRCVVESPPSLLSASSNCGSSATVSDIENPVSGYGISHVRIYRFDAGWKTGSEGSVQNNSGTLMIAEIPIGQSSYVDNNNLSDPDMMGCLTYDFESMPHAPDGVGSTAFSLFTWVDNELYISAAGMPEVRPKSGRFCFDDNIVTAKYWNNAIYVFTERWAYRIDEAVSASGATYSNPPYRFEKILPIVNEFSLSVGATGIFYQTASGIVIISGSNMFNVSTGIISTIQWKKLRSNNIRTFVYQQHLFIFSIDWDYTHVFEFEDGVFTDREYSNHTIYPYQIQSMAIEIDGGLLFGSGSDIYRFKESEGNTNAFGKDTDISICTDCCPYDYRMLVKHAVQITDYASGYIRIDASKGGVQFSLIDKSCGERVVYERTFDSCGEHEFRLPSCYLSQEHEVRLQGCATVFELRLGTNAKQLGLNN